METESELELVKFGRLRLRPGIAGQHPAEDGDFGRTAVHLHEYIERREEKENDSVYIKLKSNLVMEFRLINGI